MYSSAVQELLPQYCEAHELSFEKANDEGQLMAHHRSAACFLAGQTGREMVESVSGDAVSSGSSNQKVSFTRPFLPAPSSTVREFDKQKCPIELTKSSPESIIIKYGSMLEG